MNDVLCPDDAAPAAEALAAASPPNNPNPLLKPVEAAWAWAAAAAAAAEFKPLAAVAAAAAALLLMPMKPPLNLRPPYP